MCQVKIEFSYSKKQMRYIINFLKFKFDKKNIKRMNNNFQKKHYYLLIVVISN